MSYAKIFGFHGSLFFFIYIFIWCCAPTTVNIRIQSNKLALHLFNILFNITIHTLPFLTSRLLYHITSYWRPLTVATKATLAGARASDARSDCCSLCRTDCSLNGLQYPNCKGPWQVSVWSTPSLPRYSSKRLRKVGLFRFVKSSTPAGARTQAQVVYIYLNEHFNRATKLHIYWSLSGA